MSGPHPSHNLRSSDASTFDVICEDCGRTDQVPGGWGKLTEPCPGKIEVAFPGGKTGWVKESQIANLEALRKPIQTSPGIDDSDIQRELNQ